MKSLTLLELLRRRRALSVGEIARLLADLPTLLDEVEQLGGLPDGSLLGLVEVVFAGDEADGTVLDWPEFRLNLLADATQAETQIQIDPPGTAPSARLAVLLYEMLGGPHCSDGAHPPLAALGEKANGTLQRALAGGFGCCAEFWRKFLGDSEAPPRLVRVPEALREALREAGTRGDLLKLAPRGGGTPIRLVARQEFRIGRSLAEADLVARFLPETPENLARTHELGRVQVFGEIIDGEPALRDGTGTRPSANGTTVQSRPLTAEAPVRLRHRSEIALSGSFTFEAIPLLAPTADFEIENLAVWGGSAVWKPPLLGAVVFAAPAHQPFVREAVWLFTRVDFAPGVDGSLAWLSPGRKYPAAFLHAAGFFWIVNGELPRGQIEVGGHALAPGEAAPLTTETTVRLGTREFAMKVE